MHKQMFLTIYKKAMSFYKEKKYGKALSILDNYECTSGIRTLQGDLLKCAILRDSGKYVEEIELLDNVGKVFANVNDDKGMTEFYTMQGEVFSWQGDNDSALANYLQAAKLAPTPKRKLEAIGSILFTVNAMENISAVEMQDLYALYRDNIIRLGIKQYPQATWYHKKIHIGYISADFCQHAVSQFVRPLLFDFDKDNFQIFVYQVNDIDDYITEKMRKSSSCWRKVANMDFDEIAKIIREDEIDILFDLGGHTKNNVLPVFAYHAAKIQISGIGYFNSTGLYDCDGFLSDVYCAIDETSPYFTEKLLRLPHTHFCYQPFNSFKKITSPPFLFKGYITFGSFNNFAKVGDGVLLLWRKILFKVPNSRLLIKHRLMGTEAGRRFICRRLMKFDMPLDRIEMRGLSSGYLAEYGDMDIALDTFPYTGGLTTCEALFMGVPIVTLVGERHGSRFGWSFLNNIGLSELAAKDKEEYVKIAVALAKDGELLVALRKKIRTLMKQSPLMNGKTYMQDLEALYKKMLKEYYDKNEKM